MNIDKWEKTGIDIRFTHVLERLKEVKKKQVDDMVKSKVNRRMGLDIIPWRHLK